MQFIDFEVYTTPDDSIKSTGNNKKGVIIFSLSKDTEKEIPFLTKILAAVKLNLTDDVALFSLTQNQAISLAEVLKTQQATKVLVFGAFNKDIGIHLNYQPYQPIIFNNIQFLFADDLLAIMNEKSRKAALWAALQDLFLK